jgi:hypothetical protein
MGASMTEYFKARFRFDGMNFLGFAVTEVKLDESGTHNRDNLCKEMGKELNKFKDELKRVCDLKKATTFKIDPKTEWNISTETKVRIKKFDIDMEKVAKGIDENTYVAEFPDIFLEDELGVSIGFKVDIGQAKKDGEYFLIPIIPKREKTKLSLLTTFKK